MRLGVRERCLRVAGGRREVGDWDGVGVWRVVMGADSRARLVGVDGEGLLGKVGASSSVGTWWLRRGEGVGVRR